MKTVSSIKQQIMEILDKLPAGEQQQVLTFAQSFLHELPGMSPEELRAFFSQYHFSQEEADEITKMYQELEELEH